VIARHAPDGPPKCQRPEDQLQYGELAVLLAAPRVHRSDPALPRVIDTRIRHHYLFSLLNPHHIVLHPDLHRVAPQALIPIEAKIVEPNLAILAYLAGQLAQP
jgi:hypothetical protein